jgi:hypothetical protein
MRTTADEILTPQEAARRIFNTTSPTPQQVSNVIALLKTGAIERNVSHNSTSQYTTTVQAVADYLSRVETARSESRGRTSHAHATTPIDAAGRSVSQFYQGLLQDYFLAVLLQRKQSARSDTFHKAVLASQVVILLVGLSIIGFAVSQAWKKPWVSPEQEIVEAWLVNKFAEVKIRSVQPHAADANAVVASYTYRDGGRMIESKMKFTLSGGQVLSADSSQ